MTFEDLIRLINYTQPEDIDERQALIREYCYMNNIDLKIFYK